MERLSALGSIVLSLAREPYAVLTCLLALGFMLLSSVLNVRTLKKSIAGDFAAVMLYFASFFILLFVVPLTYLFSLGPGATLTPSMLGLKLGDTRRGLLICLASLPLDLLIAYLGSVDPAMREQYPLSRQAEAGLGRFALFETAYLLFFYVAWEFAFRGVMLFSLVRLLPAGLSGAVIAIVLPSIVSMVYHMGHPHLEVGGTLFAGIAFGTIALLTGSILYSIAIHALIGILEDVFLYRAHLKSGCAVNRRAMPVGE